MKYVSIDIETTGLDPDQDQMIEFAAVLADSNLDQVIEELPYFHTYIVRDRYKGSAQALAMHPTIFQRIAAQTEGYQYLSPGELSIRFPAWLQCQGVVGRVTPAGKNFGSFDLQFLRRDLPGVFTHRALDPGTLWFDPDVDRVVPNLGACLLRAGLDPTVAHTALEDARAVIACLQAAWRMK